MKKKRFDEREKEIHHAFFDSGEVRQRKRREMENVAKKTASQAYA